MGTAPLWKTIAMWSKRWPGTSPFLGWLNPPLVFLTPVVTSTRSKRRSMSIARSQGQAGDNARKTWWPRRIRSAATTNSWSAPTVPEERPFPLKSLGLDSTHLRFSSFLRHSFEHVVARRWHSVFASSMPHSRQCPTDWGAIGYKIQRPSGLGKSIWASQAVLRITVAGRRELERRGLDALSRLIQAGSER